MALRDDILFIVLHSLKIGVLSRLVNTAIVVVSGGLSPHEDFRLAALTTLLTVVIFIRVRSIQLVLRALVQRAFVLQFPL